MTWPEPDRWEDAEPAIQRFWNANQATLDRRWEEVRDYYRFGWEWARSRTYTGLTFEQAEPDLRRMWEQLKPEGQPPWEEIRDLAKAGWKRGRDDSWGHDWRRTTW